MRNVPHLALTPTDKAITITCDDRDPAAGNMSHRYTISLVDPLPAGSADLDIGQTLKFQHGPIKEAGVNGITNEALLAIVADRLRGAQEGPFACPENGYALQSIEMASLWLGKRTLDRMARGVEGQNKV
jgi:hypothetical protein